MKVKQGKPAPADMVVLYCKYKPPKNLTLLAIRTGNVESKQTRLTERLIPKSEGVLLEPKNSSAKENHSEISTSSL